MKKFDIAVAASLVLLVVADALAETPKNLRDNQLIAWCIVPFDGKKRGPAERAEMVKRIGMRRVAYDWRQQHVPTFEEEIRQYREHGIELFAFWGAHEKAFELFKKYKLHPQIWKTLPSPQGKTQEERVQAAAKQMLSLVERTRKLDCKLGLYNHGGWGGEPTNMVAVAKYLREKHNAKHVGIVYNLHHAHSKIDTFAASLATMKPFLLCLNLNGMTRNGDRRGQKILPLAAGELDLKLLKVIADSGYQGPMGIIGHTQDDVEMRLRDNLDGLHWLLPQLEGKATGAKPNYRTWKSAKPKPNASQKTKPSAKAAPPKKTAAVNPYSPQLVNKLMARLPQGDAHRGLLVFASAKSACISCHRIGGHGTKIGPELTSIAAKQKPAELIESILWPKRKVQKEYQAVAVIADDGRMHKGYVVRRDARQLVMRDPTKSVGAEITIPIDEIDEEQPIGTLMPDNLAATMSETELVDLLRLVTTLGKSDGIPAKELESLLMHAQAHQHGPTKFPFKRDPLVPKQWPSWQRHINRDRVYDFYAKQADHFRQQAMAPPLLAEFPGLDGGALGHWGNQNDTTWADGRWNETELSSVQCGVFRAGRVVVPRGVCIRLGDNGELSCCFNPDTLTYDAVWQGGFVKFDSRRKGFLGGLTPIGKVQSRPAGKKPSKKFRYQGFYRHGKRVLFAYRIGEIDFLDTPWVENGKFTRIVSPVDKHPLRHLLKAAPSQWPQELETKIELGDGQGYVVDTIRLPFDNPWKALLFCGGHAFLPDGSALVCTMQGDVWRASGFQHPSQRAKWGRIAAGLHQPLGIVIDKDGIFVLGRDQITRLHDLNNDGEADYYESFCNAYHTSPGGHDFICGLERDALGRFYTASSSQGLVRISADGERSQVVATGFRNPDGIGLLPDGTLTIPCSEGTWTPASMICAVKPNANGTPLHFGYRGPKKNKVPALPLVYLTRGLDNSSGGQVFVSSKKWGPLAGQLLHFSFGMGSHFLVLRDEVDGQLQGAVVPLPGEFRSGAHRGRFHPQDGQLYVTGMQGWGSYTPEDGCFQRVRYTGDNTQMPTGFRVHQNGIAITFAETIDRDIAASAKSHFAQCWNYRYGPGYGSPEFSTKHFGMRGHDVLKIHAAHVLEDGRTLFLEIPELQPVNQLHLRLQSAPQELHELFVTVHKLAQPFTELPNYQPVKKKIRSHPILADLAMATRSVPNPYRKKIDGAQVVQIETGSNLSFKQREFRVRAGQVVALTLVNPDVVPHNWALVERGTLAEVGDLANRLISDPEAALRHYVPKTPKVLAYTNVVLPGEKFTIYFRAPQQPGRYPYLCTFPGHWKIMNGELIVEKSNK